MNTQYYTTTTSPVLTFEEYHDIPSEHITGQRSTFSQRARTLMEVDLKLIYRAIREAIQKDMRGDEDGRVYSVAYKIYDIQARLTICLFMNADTMSSPDVSRRCKPGVKTASRLLMSPILTAGYGPGIWPG